MPAWIQFDANVSMSANQNDEFGDFDQPNTAANDEDFGDFGDFGDFDSAPLEASGNQGSFLLDSHAAPAAVVVEEEEEEEELAVLDDEFEARFLKDLDMDKLLSDDLDKLLKRCFPIPTRIADNDIIAPALFNSPTPPSSPSNIPPTILNSSKYLLELSPEFGAEGADSGDVYRFFSLLQTLNIYNDQKSMFQWRKSMIRTAFLESISNMKFDPFANRSGGGLGSRKQSKESINHADGSTSGSKSNVSGDSGGTSKPTVSVPHRQSLQTTTESTVDSREKEMVAAKKQCDIPEDEIRNMSRQELRDFIGNLNQSISQMQDQANYWLDSKEQLVMESEMHNKMIASLVTYAQQKHSTLPAIKKKK